MSINKSSMISDIVNKDKKETGKTVYSTILENIIPALIGAVATVAAALIAYGIFKPTNDPHPESSIWNEPAKNDLWNDSKEKYVWFNAQYRLANESHDINHYNYIVKNEVEFTFILIQPDSATADFNNFKEKFFDFRRFLRKLRGQGEREHKDVAPYLNKIYIFRERKIPSISFFITNSPKYGGREKAIIYFEEKFLMDGRKPELCLETINEELVRELNNRANFLIENAKAENRLQFSDLVESTPDESLFLKE